MGQLHHPPARRRRRRHADRADRPDRAERRPPAAARQDPRLRLQRQRLDQRRSGHRGGRACSGFQVGLEEQTHSAVTVDYNNDPLCGGDLPTTVRRRRRVRRRSTNLGPATYFIDVHPPARAVQQQPEQPVVPDDHDRRRPAAAGRRSRRAPTAPARPASSCGSRRTTAPRTGSASSASPQAVRRRRAPARSPARRATGSSGPRTRPAPSTSRWRTRSSRCPTAATDQTVFVGQGDARRQLRHPERPGRQLQPRRSGTSSSATSCGSSRSPSTPARPSTSTTRATTASVGVGVSRWFGWLDGTVYKDLNNNGKYDAGVDTALANTDMDQRWRDGSIKEVDLHRPARATTSTRPPRAARSAAGSSTSRASRASRRTPGPSVHDEHTGAVTPSCAVDGQRSGQPMRPDRPGRRPADQPAPARRPPRHGRLGQARLRRRRRPGQIVGITYFATTRNEFDARMQAHEDYEPAIPDVTVYLESPGPDGTAEHGRRRHRQQVRHRPLAAAEREPGPAGRRQHFTPELQPDQGLRRATTSPRSSTRASARTASRCRSPASRPRTAPSTAATPSPTTARTATTCAPDDGTCDRRRRPGRRSSPAPTSRTRSCRPTRRDTRPCNPVAADPQRQRRRTASIPGGGTGCLYRPVKEEDVNVDLGNHFTPAIPPPPCTGDDHVIDQSTLVPRSNYFGNRRRARTAVRQEARRRCRRPERQRRLQPDDQLPHRPERRRPERRPHR